MCVPDLQCSIDLKLNCLRIGSGDEQVFINNTPLPPFLWVPELTRYQPCVNTPQVPFLSEKVRRIDFGCEI